MFAEVLLKKAAPRIDKIYHYAIPEALEKVLRVGAQVRIPFGKRSALGYVVGIIGESRIKGIKKIEAVVSAAPLFTEKQVALARWMSDYYCSFFVSALRLLMPPGGERRALAAEKSETKCEARNELRLTDEQDSALKEINAAIDAGRPDKFLLYGVTGSGKTEIYLQAIAHLLKKGKSSIVLVPEIALTPQLVMRFKARFQGRIALLHSHLTLKQRDLEWERIASGEARIVIGARSAVFAPVKDLGLIVIDEEFENSYKQDKSPRYHAREVAFFLARQNNAVVVLGTATPSVETYYQAERGEIKKLTMAKRIDDRPLPPVTVVDMRNEKRFILSQRLRDELKETLARGEQAILFINRRGYFTFVMCRECGFTLQCPNCSIALTYHSGERRLRCSRCDHSAEPPNRCPRCNSSAITYFGTGTQRIEKEVAEVVPQARIIRYDSDSVSKRGSHEVLFSAFAEKKADILIGTQMVAKGLDIADVTLVGVVSADTALNLPDFRAAERTFQLLAQVAGRAGRHHLPGKVIVQTYDPDNYAIKAAVRHDYDEFYEREKKYRQELNYPPFSRLISLLFSGKESAPVQAAAESAKKLLSARIHGGILGPAPAVISKLRGNWRYYILLKGESIEALREAVLGALKDWAAPADVRLTVDIDPVEML